ncbi:hypothetical protein QBC47DRAFT_317274 [Echria macrotheca]|uniref:BTB domain-containing protein n=1 Tax=Echria macrotheca TaxID=438768 RepID=A0AAJ0BH37_9PEZI|nr:hypothetical protein QBC47DRAFT_317274 [Echria macrotheca]
MDSVWTVLLPLPWLKGNSPVYRIDPEADVLAIIPPNREPFAPWDSGQSSSDAPAKDVQDGGFSNTGLRIQVSSKHLILASDIFKQKLRHFSRNSTVQPDGRIHLLFGAGTDPRAAAIVLDAVHGRAFKTPRSVNLDTLAQIALFVHKFQLVEAVSVYADRWIGGLLSSGGGIPKEYGRELILWIYISQVFEHTETLESAMRVAVMHSFEKIRTLGLPLDEKIIHTIDIHRRNLIAGVVLFIDDAISILSKGDTTACTAFHCDSLLLGELIKILGKHGLLGTTRGADMQLEGVSCAQLVEAVGALRQIHAEWLASVQRRKGSSVNVNSVNGTTESHPKTGSTGHENGGTTVGGVNGINNGVKKVTWANGTNRTNGTQGPNHTNGSGPNSETSLPSESSGNSHDGFAAAHKCNATTRRLLDRTGELEKILKGRGAGLKLSGQPTINWKKYWMAARMI